MLETRLVITLLQLPGVGRRSVQSILSLEHKPVSRASDLSQYLRDLHEKLPRIKIPTASELDQAIIKTDIIMDRAEELGITILGMDSELYPDRLRSIEDPPVILFVQGNIAALGAAKAVAVVGTREPSLWGAALGERLAETLTDQGVSIISGLAQGCDTIAHMCCLKRNGTTVAVVPHGINNVYPKANIQLLHTILEKNGCVVSEYAPDISAQRNFFIERDRIESGLSDAVLVIETDTKGGTMHTVEACLNQGRILACIAHPQKFANAKSRGNDMLIKRGDALPIREPEDIKDLIDQISKQNSLQNYKKIPTKNLNLFRE